MASSYVSDQPMNEPQSQEVTLTQGEPTLDPLPQPITVPHWITTPEGYILTLLPGTSTGGAASLDPLPLNCQGKMLQINMCPKGIKIQLDIRNCMGEPIDQIKILTKQVKED